jgi:hypothetical protein
MASGSSGGGSVVTNSSLTKKGSNSPSNLGGTIVIPERYKLIKQIGEGFYTE